MLAVSSRVIFSAVVLALLPCSAFAQTRDTEEIIVTVRKTDEDLQEVPVAVTVLGEQAITRDAIRNLSDVAAETPSLLFDQGFWPSDTRISIRGLFARAGRPSAAVLIDGIDATSEALQSSGGSALLNQRLLNLERIEVARGPQSALYGRSAFSGGINYVTRRPEGEWSATLNGDAAQNDRYEFQSVFEGPVTDDLAFGLLLSHYELDGYYDNKVKGDRIGGGKSQGLGFSLNWTPSDDFSAYWNTTFSSDDFDPQAIALVRADKLRAVDLTTGALIKDYDNLAADCGTAKRCLPVVTGNIRAREGDINLTPDPRDGNDYDGTNDDTFRTNLILDWDLGEVKLRSSSSFLDATNRIKQDTTNNFGLPDAGPPADVLSPQTFSGVFQGNYSDARYKFKFKQYFQDLQLSNGDDSAIDWLVGLNYFFEKATDDNTSRVYYRDPSNPACVFGVCDFNTVPQFDKTQERKTTSYSVYGLIGFDLSDTVKLTLEGRLIHDQVKIKGTTTDQLANVLAPFDFSYDPTAPSFRDDVDDTNFVPKATLDWQFNEQVLLYASVAKGIKPPTYNSTDIFDPVIQRVGREKLWTYEIGSKTQWFDRQLTVNTAAYYNDYKDQQTRVQFPPPPGGFLPVSGTANAGSVHIYGLELDTSWQVNDHLTTGFNYAFSKGEYDSFNLLDVSPAPPSNTEFVKAGNLEADFTDNDTPGIPDHALNLFGQYTNSLTADMDWYARANWQWQDERWADAANLVKLEAYSLVNGQIGVQTDQWYAAFYVENAFDDDTVRFAQEFIDQTEGIRGDLGFAFPVAYYGYLPQPRVFGVRFQYRTN